MFEIIFCTVGFFHVTRSVVSKVCKLIIILPGIVQGIVVFVLMFIQFLVYTNSKSVTLGIDILTCILYIILYLGNVSSIFACSNTIDKR